MASYQFNPINILDTSNATSLTDGGSMTLGGGISIGKDTFIGGNISISGTSTSFSDNILLINKNPTQSTDTGIIFQRYNSDIQNNDNYAGIIYSEQNDTFNLGYLTSDADRNYVSIGSLISINVKDITTGVATITGVSNLSSTLTVAGATTLSSTLAVVGATTLGAAVDITGALSVATSISSANIVATSLTTGSIRTSDIALNGNLVATGEITAFGSLSDIRLKTNIVDIDSISALNTVKSLRPVTFDWKSDIFNESKRGFCDVGFIAQEVEDIIPQAVADYQEMNSGTFYKSIKHERLIPYLVGAIQNLEYTNKKLEQFINLKFPNEFPIL